MASVGLSRAFWASSEVFDAVTGEAWGDDEKVPGGLKLRKGSMF